jgi:hypothetical protein
MDLNDTKQPGKPSGLVSRGEACDHRIDKNQR